MLDALFLICAFLCGLLGCSSIAISQLRHWRALFGPRAAPGRVFLARCAGWSLIAASLALCLVRDGASFGALLWPLVIGVSALCVALLLAYSPNVLKPLATLFAKAVA
ncbi:MAG: DUF3325 domain-containing protein [Pseudomonadota bacterium]